jgi:gas vesicle protein
MNRICGFLTGIGAGLGLGLLLAPRSGERTRLLIRRKATDGADYLRQRSTDVRDAASDALRDGSRRAAKGAEAVKAAVEAGRQAYSQTIRS